MFLTRGHRILRAFAAWAVVMLFVFPIYYWVTVAIKVDREIFSVPPKIFDFTASGKSFVDVFCISLG